jgi:hypothetical protein
VIEKVNVAAKLEQFDELFYILRGPLVIRVRDGNTPWRRAPRAVVSISPHLVRRLSRGNAQPVGPAGTSTRRNRQMATETTRRTARTFGPLRIAILVLAAATALVHLWLAVGMAQVVMTQPGTAASMGGATMVATLGALFFCNFAGYAVLITALYLPALRRFERVTRRVLVGYTALTIVAYFAIAQSHSIDPFGLADKAIEVALIVLLVIEARQARS